MRLDPSYFFFAAFFFLPALRPFLAGRFFAPAAFFLAFFFAATGILRALKVPRNHFMRTTTM